MNIITILSQKWLIVLKIHRLATPGIIVLRKYIQFKKAHNKERHCSLMVKILLHQGTQITPCDFIMPLHSNYKLADDKNDHHKILQANFIAQTQSLMIGKSISDVENEMKNEIMDNPSLKNLVSHRIFEGNRPSNSILFESLSPKSLGRLIAIYEHKIFTQGIIWNINSFDQWGVEYGKQIAKLVLPKLESKQHSETFDSSTNNLINYINNNT